MGRCLCIEVYDIKYMYDMVSYVINDNELLQIINTMKHWFS